jgi:ATP-binding cassette subfamily B protein
MEESIPKPNLKALKLYIHYWFMFKRELVASVLFSLALALQMTVVPLLVTLVLARLITTHTLDITLFAATGISQTAILLSSYFLDAHGVAVLHNKVTERLYEDCFRYLVRQDYSFFANNFSGSIVTQASRFAKVYTTFNDTMFFELFPQLFVVLIALAVMVHYSPILAVLLMVFWLFSQWVIVKFALRRLPLRRAAVAKESQLVGELADAVTNALTVKTFASETSEFGRYQALNAVRGGLFLKSWRRAVRNGWIVEGLCLIGQLTIFFVAIMQVKNGSLGIPAFLLIQVYMIRVIDNVRRSSFMVRQLEAVSGDAQEMTELLEQAPLIQDAPNAPPLATSQGVIDLYNVTFEYPDSAHGAKTLLHKFNLTIKAGERVGLVGPSGGGKTTLTRLLLRFLDINDGAIEIDGQDIASVQQQSLRAAIAYVPQEPLLFHRSIMENIRYGRPEASDEAIIAVAKKSFAHDFIKDLPEGYDTMVGERGVKLSGGQRQRVAIARAMLKNAPILILDEATSALDSESERVIQKALWELMKDKTAVVIAHRLSTIQRLDRIVVIDKGKIVEDGSHQALLKKAGLYARLWKHQSGGFIEEA